MLIGGKQALTSPSRAGLTPRHAGGSLALLGLGGGVQRESDALKVVRLSLRSYGKTVTLQSPTCVVT